MDEQNEREQARYETENEADEQPVSEYERSLQALTIQLSYLPAQIKAAQLVLMTARTAGDVARDAMENAKRELELVTARRLSEAYESGEIAGKNDAERKRAETLFLASDANAIRCRVALDVAEDRVREATRATTEAEIDAQERVASHRSALAATDLLSAYLRSLAHA